MDHFGYCANDDAGRCSISKTQDSKSEEMWPQHYYRNTGAVNLHLIRGVLSEKSAIHIFIHELGHSLGARHDNESEECINLTDEVFLMTGDAKVNMSNDLFRIYMYETLQVGTFQAFLFIIVKFKAQNKKTI